MKIPPRGGAGVTRKVPWVIFLSHRIPLVKGTKMCFNRKFVHMSVDVTYKFIISLNNFTR
jgi:hypothetical protein